MQVNTKRETAMLPIGGGRRANRKLTRYLAGHESPVLFPSRPTHQSTFGKPDRPVAALKRLSPAGLRVSSRELFFAKSARIED